MADLLSKGRLLAFGRHRGGAGIIEFALLLPLLVGLLGLTIDFALAIWQWNAALKALERGARIAAVSGPVASNLASLNNIAGQCGGTCMGGESALSANAYDPSFTVTCTGNDQSCTAPGSGWNATTMEWIVYGRGKTACGAATSAYSVGMCNILGMIQTPLAPTNIDVIYKTSSLGYAMRPGGPIVTISVQFNATTPPRFKFYFLGGWLFQPLVLRFVRMQTITSEDMCSAASC